MPGRDLSGGAEDVLRAEAHVDAGSGAAGAWERAVSESRIEAFDAADDAPRWTRLPP